jgi:hypothetical protein
MVVTCESDNCVFEAGGRGKARDAKTGNDESLRYALYRVSRCLGQKTCVHSRR